MMHALTTHLWQSTFFAMAAGLLTIPFRKNRAQVRYWLWLSASLKFFIPFALLMSLGSSFEKWMPAARQIATPAISYTIERLSGPFFPESVPAPTPAPDTVHWIPIAILAGWFCGFATVALIRFRNWLRIRAAVRTSAATNISATMEVRVSSGLLEPGVVGLRRPILLLPEGIAEHLTPSELNAVLAHELCHIRRRDNLFATIHMIVEAIFWFHPLVWWIGARLVEERERACDEQVLSEGNHPEVYADAILSVCKLYVESPLACVSGVSGASIRRRIEAIMSNRQLQGLNHAKKFLLASAAIVALTGPVAIGLLIGVGDAPPIRAQSHSSRVGQPAAPVPVPSPQAAQVSTTTVQEAAPKSQPVAPLEFDAASIRLVKGSGGGGRSGPLGGFPLEFSPGRVTGRSVSTRSIILAAYHLTPYQLSGGPDWLDSETFDVEATAADASANENQLRKMLQTLLAERFKLVVSRQTRETPVYALVVAKNGPKLHEIKDDEPTPTTGKELVALGVLPPPRAGERPTGRMFSRDTMEQFAAELSIYPELDRPVLDRTGLKGVYLVALTWYADGNITTAMQDWLGLKLEPQKAPMDTLVVDHVEKPGEN